MKEIPLSKNAVAIVDDADFDYLSKFRWCLNGSGYAVRSAIVDGKRKHIFMHREVGNIGVGLLGDHINRNRLDNRRTNIRPVSHSGNARNRGLRSINTSGLIGVSFDKRLGKWRSFISINGKNKAIGCFSAKEDAGRMYNEYARKLYGELAVLNMV